MGSTHYGLCYGMVCRDVGLRRGWHQPAFKGLFEDRLAQEGAASEAGLHGGFDLIEDREASVKFSQDSQLFWRRDQVVQRCCGWFCRSRSHDSSGLLQPGELPLVSPKMRPILRPLTPAGLKTKMLPDPEARL
jgi:hypothetical protein